MAQKLMTLSSESRLGGIPFSFFLYISAFLVFYFSLPFSAHSQPYNTWQQLDPNAGVPFLRNQFDMISAPGNEDSIFMFFGFDEFDNSIYNETWIYNRNENWWSQMQLDCTTSFSCPSPRIGYSLMSFGGGEDFFDAKHRRSPSSSSRHSIRIDSPSPPSQGSILMFGGQRVVGSYPGDFLWSFDIQTSNWSLLSTGIKNNASLPSVRAFQSGIPFDNRFVIFGGEWAGSENLNDLWSFDPTTLRWSPLGNQDSTWPPPTSRHSAVVWEDSMFVFGGCVAPADDGCGVNNNLWIFNFTSSEWNRLVSNGTNDPNWPAGRQSHVGVLAGEKMVVYGGLDEYGNVLSDGWEYDFSNMTWKVVPPQSIPAEGRYAQASVVVGGDSILLFGGSGTCDKTPIMSVFYGWNVTTDAFYPILSPMLQQPQEPYVTTSTDGAALYFTTVYAGFARYFVAPEQAYWQALSPVPVVQREPICGLVTLNASTLALFQLNPAQLNIYYYDTTTDVWTTETVKDVTDCRSAIRVQDNTIYVLQSTALLSLQTDTTPPVVTTLAAPPVSLSNGDAAVVVSDGVYVFGVSPTSYLLYNITQNNWTQPSLLSTSAGAPIDRNHPSVVSIGMKILVFGGEVGGSELFGDLWEFDTVVGNWSQMITGGVGNFTPTARYWSAGAAVGTTMYLFGGFNGYVYLTDFWAIALACNAGTSCSQNFYEGSSCLPCAYGNYSMNAGSSECTSCPFGLTTLETGATSNSQCTNCTKNYCHRGSCTPIPAVGVKCQCDFGFLPFDRCFFPWLWMFGVVAASLVVWGIVRFRTRLAVQKGTIRQQEEELAQLYDVWKIDPTELTWVSRLSSGGFGDVWRCEWRENVVAVKKLLQHWVRVLSFLLLLRFVSSFIF
jgi:hypothetical protein